MTTTLTTRLRELMEEATPGPLKVVGVRMEDGSISVGAEKHRIVIADFTNAASFGDFIKEAFERRSFGSPDAAKTQWANVNLYLELVNNAPTIIRLLEAGDGAEKALEDCASFMSGVRPITKKPLTASEVMDLVHTALATLRAAREGAR